MRGKQTKRALEITAAGGHNVLITGPLGCGKSLLSETFPSVLPPKQESQFEVMSICQLSRATNSNYQISPFSASGVSLISEGADLKPLEVLLAYLDVLFMAKFPKRTLDILRQPMEAGKVIV